MRHGPSVVGGAFRLAQFISGTTECIPRRRIRNTTTLKYGVARCRESQSKTPWGIITMTALLFGAALGSFLHVNMTSEASLVCRPTEVHCKLMDGSMSKIFVEQSFDMDAGCAASDIA